jgi:hypothetical protein
MEQKRVTGDSWNIIAYTNSIIDSEDELNLDDTLFIEEYCSHMEED